MSKLFFYIMLSSVAMLSFYFFKQGLDYSEKENIVPKELRLMMLDAEQLNRNSNNQKNVFVIGTSHVGSGFSECYNTSVNRRFESNISGKKSIRLANSIMFSSFLEGRNNINLILEATIIEDVIVSRQKENGILYEYISTVLPVISDTLKSKLSSEDKGCGELPLNDNHAPDLEYSRTLSEKIDHEYMTQLFSAYTNDLDSLVRVCNDTKNARITLVSLPIHSDLYAIPDVRNVFNLLDSKMTTYLTSVQRYNSCDISYLNLTKLGAEFPEQKFWADPGHFLPEVGERVLQEIELFHANKKTH